MSANWYENRAMEIERVQRVLKESAYNLIDGDMVYTFPFLPGEDLRAAVPWLWREALTPS
jgi:hypothetical protein